MSYRSTLIALSLIGIIKTYSHRTAPKTPKVTEFIVRTKEDQVLDFSASLGVFSVCFGGNSFAPSHNIGLFITNSTEIELSENLILGQFHSAGCFFRRFATSDLFVCGNTCFALFALLSTLFRIFHSGSFPGLLGLEIHSFVKTAQLHRHPNVRSLSDFFDTIMYLH